MQHIISSEVDPSWSGAVEEINRLHHEILDSLRLSIPKAIRIGEVLSGIKISEFSPGRRKIPHGHWQAWIKNHCRFSYDSAARYMRYYENKEFLKSCMDETSELKMNEADALIASSNGQENRPGGEQKLHEPNFYSKEFRLRQNFIGQFNHYLKRKPLRLWETDEITDFLTLIRGFSLVIDKLETELQSRNELVAS